MVKWLWSLLAQQLPNGFSTTISRLPFGKVAKLYRTGMKMKAVLSSHREGVNPICGSRGFYSGDHEYWAQHASAQQAITPCSSSSIKILSPNLIYVCFQFQGARGHRGSQVCLFVCDQFSLRTVFCFFFKIMLPFKVKISTRKENSVKTSEYLMCFCCGCIRMNLSELLGITLLKTSSLTCVVF